LRVKYTNNAVVNRYPKLMPA